MFLTGEFSAFTFIVVEPHELIFNILGYAFRFLSVLLWSTSCFTPFGFLFKVFPVRFT